MVVNIAKMLELNMKITPIGSWYTMLPFGDPQKLRNAKQRIEEMMDESVAAVSKGIENLELQEATLKAKNKVGKL